jgi:hypothetical protein
MASRAMMRCGGLMRDLRGYLGSVLYGYYNLFLKHFLIVVIFQRLGFASPALLLFPGAYLTSR